MTEESIFTAEAKACHEAGHAVAGLIFDLPFTKASIKRDGPTVGRVDLDGNPMRDHLYKGIPLQDAVDRWAIAYYAGNAAEIAILGAATIIDAVDLVGARNAISVLLKSRKRPSLQTRRSNPRSGASRRVLSLSYDNTNLHCGAL